MFDPNGDDLKILERERLCGNCVSFWFSLCDIYPKDIIAAIISTLLEVDTVITFKTKHKAMNRVNIYWKGKYTNGEIDWYWTRIAPTIGRGTGHDITFEEWRITRFIGFLEKIDSPLHRDSFIKSEEWKEMYCCHVFPEEDEMIKEYLTDDYKDAVIFYSVHKKKNLIQIYESYIGLKLELKRVVEMIKEVGIDLDDFYADRCI